MSLFLGVTHGKGEALHFWRSGALSRRTRTVNALRDIQPGRTVQLMMACFSEVPLIKQVVVVDPILWSPTSTHGKKVRLRVSDCIPARCALICK